MVLEVVIISTAPGLESGLQILETVTKSRRIGFNQLKNELGLSPGSLNRYLKTLSDRGFVGRDENQQYVPGQKLIDISRCAGDIEWMSSAIQPLLENVSLSLGYTSVFICFRQARMVCAEKYMVQDGLAMQDTGEERTDYILHPWGFLLLAGFSPERRRYLIENANVYERFRAFIPESGRLDRYIREAGEYRYSDDKGEIFRNIRRIAVPVYTGSDKMLTGAIGIGMPVGAPDDTDINHITAVLLQKADSLSRVLSGS